MTSNATQLFHHSSDVVVGSLMSITTTNVFQNPGSYDNYWVQYLLDHVVSDALHNANSRSAEPKCHPETRVALRQDIQTWITDGDGDSNPKRILWITGPAGSGKTAIASTIVSACAEKGILAASFFFSAFAGSAYRQSNVRLIPTLAYQLLQHRRAIKGIDRKIIASVEQDPLVFEKQLDDQFKALILEPLSDIVQEGIGETSRWPKVVVIDGLDECIADGGEVSSKGGLRGLTEAGHEETLSLLFAAATHPSFPFRVIVASRPEPVIQAFVSARAESVQTLFLGDKYDANHDITLFLKAKFAEIRRRYRIRTNWPTEDALKILVERASGQFIYAVTIIRFIDNSCDQPWIQLNQVLKSRAGTSRLTHAPNPFVFLDALYSRVLESSPKPTLSVKWILAIRLLQDETSNCDGTFIRPFLEADPGEMEYLLGNLRSLISLGDNDLPSFHIYHQSLLEFLADSGRSGLLHVNQDALHSFLKGRWSESLKMLGPQIISNPQNSIHEGYLDWCRELSRNPDFGFALPHREKELNDQETPSQPFTDFLGSFSKKPAPLDLHVDNLITKESGVVTLRVLLNYYGSHRRTPADIQLPKALGKVWIWKKPCKFINVAAGKPIAAVSGALTANENELAVRHFTLKNPRPHSPNSPDKLILVDTPGFDNYYRQANDATILQRIIEWLTTRCSRDAQLGGIIYFHDITQDRGAMEYNQTWLAAYLTDPEPVRHLLLATVKWDRVSAPPHTVNYEEREDRLSRTVWRGMLDRGARVARFANTQDSAWAVISQLLERQPIDIHILHEDLLRIRARGEIKGAVKKKGFSAIYKWFQ
ncbi:hypothetical protein FA13DRAFT_1799812 [Coprinellus micaceus]|uniref:Nephrocystin 3-like N-terminal domain-containing protein n=1 Tax=Coprinellus micaceus TaxID=71717 RepID=A0A4Y7SI54_COPMI|nr:hypothetical protein FA13DRAFT_1799812 [Coprinellus micaceus]